MRETVRQLLTSVEAHAAILHAIEAADTAGAASALVAAASPSRETLAPRLPDANEVQFDASGRTKVFRPGAKAAGSAPRRPSAAVAQHCQQTPEPFI